MFEIEDYHPSEVDILTHAGRITVRLARLWQSQGKRAEARQMLAEIYSWFTEGFDTADLREAKELLDALL